MDEHRIQTTPPAQESPPHELEADYSEDGVDLTLIRWMLSLPPTDRLEVLQSAVRSLARLKEATFCCLFFRTLNHARRPSSRIHRIPPLCLRG
jgi:hypothetical protein